MVQLRALEKQLSETEICMWEQIITIREEANDTGKNTVTQWSMKLVIGKDKQNWQALIKLTRINREYPN